MKAHVPILILLLLLMSAVIDSRAATLTVNKTADTNDGACDADCSLREAVAAAASGDTVVFSTLFNTPQTITLTLGQITIDKNLTITGTSQDLVTISGNMAGRIFNITGNVNVTMSEMKLRDGKVGTTSSEDAVGGAILMASGSLNLTNMELAYNTAFYPPSNSGDGGAVTASNLTLTNVNVHHNVSPGPAVFVLTSNITDSVVSDNTFGISGQTVNITNVIITGNSFLGVEGEFLTITGSTISGNGRGVATGNAVSTMTIENSVISGNTNAGLSSGGVTIIRNTIIINNQFIDSGGGIAAGGTLYIINSAIIGNLARLNGGGIRTTAGSHLFLTNSTVSGNIAGAGLSSAVGGGVYGQSSASVMLTNSSISNNRTSGSGGGFRTDVSGSAVRNTLIAGNTSTNTNEEDVSGNIISNGINLIGNTFGSSGWIAGDLLNVNPMLGPLADNGGGTMTHALLPGSPAINAGNNSVAIDPQTQMPLTVDQRGFLRFYGAASSTVDIGAYEVQPEITGTVTYGNATGSPTPRFVSGVLLSALGSPILSATSRADGTYTLGGFGSGAYTVIPTLVGGANGISSFDAGLIAKHVAGLQVLTGNQLIVADVSGNGTLSSFDAGQIARYTVGISGFGSSGNWIFVPVSRTYSSVNSTQGGQDFIALLMGDVSGNWTP